MQEEVFVVAWTGMSTGLAAVRLMSADNFVKMIEELVDLKVQQHAGLGIKTTPVVATVLRQKREADRQRLEQLRVELVRLLTAPQPN